MSDSIKSKKKLPLLLPPSTITVRNVPHEVDAAITEQAKLAGKSKSDYVQEFLTAHFGDLIGNFIRSSPLVRLMDREVEKLTGARLSEGWFYLHSPAENTAYCRIFGITSTEQLQTIMMAGMDPALLALRADTHRYADVIPHGISLYFALFVEAARRAEMQLLGDMHRVLFFRISEQQFLDEINALRKVMRLDALVPEDENLI